MASARSSAVTSIPTSVGNPLPFVAREKAERSSSLTWHEADGTAEQTFSHPTRNHWKLPELLEELQHAAACRRKIFAWRWEPGEVERQLWKNMEPGHSLQRAQGSGFRNPKCTKEHRGLSHMELGDPRSIGLRVHAKHLHQERLALLGALTWKVGVEATLPLHATRQHIALVNCDKARAIPVQIHLVARTC